MRMQEGLESASSRKSCVCLSRIPFFPTHSCHAASHSGRRTAPLKKRRDWLKKPRGCRRPWPTWCFLFPAAILSSLRTSAAQRMSKMTHEMAARVSTLLQSYSAAALFRSSTSSGSIVKNHKTSYVAGSSGSQSPFLIKTLPPRAVFFVFISRGFWISWRSGTSDRMLSKMRSYCYYTTSCSSHSTSLNC